MLNKFALNKHIQFQLLREYRKIVTVFTIIYYYKIVLQHFHQQFINEFHVHVDKKFKFVMVFHI